MFFPESFIVLADTFRSLIHFGLILRCGEVRVYNSSLWTWLCSCPSAVCWEDDPVEVTWLLYHTQLAVIILICFRASAPFVCVSDLTPASYGGECWCFGVGFGSGSVRPPPSCLLLTCVLTLPSPLPFPVNCGVSVSISGKQSLLGFGESCHLSNTESSHVWTWMCLH